MRKYFIVIALLVVIGLVASLYLIPGEEQMAVMQQKDDEIRANAGSGHTTSPEAHKSAYEAGDRSDITVAGWAAALISEGRGGEALPALESHLQENPSHIESRKQLALLYQAAGRDADYLAEIEKIVAQQPSESSLKMLADMYNYTKQYDKQAETLKKLIDMSGGNNPEYYVDLATILMLQDRKSDAAVALQDLRQRHPDYVSFKLTRLTVVNLVDTGESDKAYTEASAWVSKTPSSPKETADLTNIINYGGRPDLALQLVNLNRDQITQDIDLFTAYINASMNGGQRDQAYAVLDRVYNEGKLPPALYRSYIELALERDENDKALAVVQKIENRYFSQDEAINLVELARVSNAPNVMDALVKAFDQAAYLTDKPALDAIIAMIQRKADEKAKVETALNAKLNSNQRLRLAQNCARYNNTDCFNRVVAQFPAYADMTPRELDEVVMLYISVDRQKEILPKVTDAAKTSESDIVRFAWVKLVTSMGEDNVVKPWLTQHGRNTSTGKLTELFFLANDRRHGATAAAIAEVLYDREATPKHREYLVSAYMRSGDYRQALPHLRELRGTSRSNEDNYLAALTHLSRGDAGYRKELSDYAIAQLDSNEVSSERKLQLVYMLINSGNKKLAMPYINQYAKNGGQWRTLYNQVNAVATKGSSTPGKPALADMPRDYRVALAADANTSEDTKRMLAFSLIDDGYRDDAVAIFEQLAANKHPESQEVKDLLYMWGPRLNEQQIAWISSRAQASDGASRVKWGEYISYYGDDYALMHYVTSNPESLAQPTLRQKYFNAMATHGSADSFDRGMAPWVNATNDPAALKDYADVAQAYGFSEAAVRALKKIETLAPQDEKVLKDLGVLTFSQSNYQDSEKYLNQYMQTHTATPQPQTVPFEALFFKGELARRERRADEATAYYAQVLNMGPSVANTVQRQSMYYSAQFHLGHHQAGKDGFYGLLAQYPSDKSLLADFMSILIEYKYYDEATAVANRYDTSSAQNQHSVSPMSFESPDVENIESFNNGSELKINFSKPLPRDYSLPQGQQHSWVKEQTVGQNSVVVAAKEGYQLRFTPTSSTSVAIIPAVAQELTAQERMRQQQELRLQMLYARLELETGQEQQALSRLNTLNTHYPNDAQLMGYTANAENYTGNWSRALSLLDQAHSINPHNQDIAMLKRDIEKLHSQHVMIDHEWRRIGNSDEQITTLSAMGRLADNVEIGLNLQNNELDASGLRRAYSGQIDDYEYSKQRGELYAAYYFDDGGRLQVSGYANNDAGGAGLSYAFNNPLGRTELLAEYQRPYWDFVEAVAEDATRDRVGARHVTNLTNKTTVAGEVSYNRYNIALEDDVAQTALIRANIVHQIRSEGPYLAVGYGFDGEYVTDKTYRPLAGSGGNKYSPFPMNSREIHYPHLIVEQDFSDSTRALFVGGYAYDRLGEHGPQGEIRLTHDITDDLEAQLRARYGLQTNDSDQNAMSVGGHIKYKF